MHMTGLMKNRVNTLQQVTHVYFDFATPKGLEITLSDKMEKKREREKSEKRKRVEDNKKETFLLIFTSSTLEVSGKKNTSE